MKPTEAQIETCLRHAPRPTPLGGLKEKLCDQIQLPPVTSAVESRAFAAPSWWQRWWPTLAPAAASVALAAWAVVQQQEIATLQDTVKRLQNIIQAATNHPPARVEAVTSGVESSQNEAAELERLRQRITTLQGEVGQLEAVQLANARLREQVVAAGTSLSQPELDAMNEAKARAMRIKCMNNLKQVGLAVRLYMADNNEVSPPDFLTMSNKLNTPKILFCPAHTNLPPVKTWAEFAATASSYQYLVAGVTNADVEPQRIMTHCATHNIFGLCDGSVQDCSRRRYEDCVVERDGKPYLELKTSAQQP